jgi:hypothetical protein
MNSLNPSAGRPIAVPGPSGFSGWVFLCLVAALATALDFAAAVAYWSPQGVTPAQVLRSIASWALGPRPPATALVLAVGAGVHFLIYLAMAAVLSRLLVNRRFPASPGFAIGSLYGIVAYVVVYQLLVPVLVFPLALDRSPAWVAVCLAVHALVIGPLMAFAFGLRRARIG